MNPVIQIRNLAVSFGESISFLSMRVKDTLAPKLLPSFARLGGWDTCFYLCSGNEKAAMLIAAWSG
jgi:hypothetical protein